jgi:DNA replication protein DnaC
MIPDKVGYLPFSKSRGSFLFHLISEFYEKTSLLIITNQPFSEWPHIFGGGNLTMFFKSLGGLGL